MMMHNNINALAIHKPKSDSTATAQRGRNGIGKTVQERRPPVLLQHNATGGKEVLDPLSVYRTRQIPWNFSYFGTPPLGKSFAITMS